MHHTGEIYKYSDLLKFIPIASELPHKVLQFFFRFIIQKPIGIAEIYRHNISTCFVKTLTICFSFLLPAI